MGPGTVSPVVKWQECEVYRWRYLNECVMTILRHVSFLELPLVVFKVGFKASRSFRSYLVNVIVIGNLLLTKHNKRVDGKNEARRVYTDEQTEPADFVCMYC